MSNERIFDKNKKRQFGIRVMENPNIYLET